jgi:REP element-mobilizing transposase RayT
MDKHHRNSTRLRTFDYASSGAYFITSCAHQRECTFGQVLEGRMECNDVGNIILETWNAIPGHFSSVTLDEFVVMPNHIHGIVQIGYGPAVGAQHAAPLHGAVPRSNVAPGSLGAIVRSFKSAVTKRINDSRGTPGLPVWQRNYHDRVIRDDRELNAVRDYIASNPANWSRDLEATTDLELHEFAFQRNAVMA